MGKQKGARAGLRVVAKNKQALAAIAIGAVVTLGMVLALALSGAESDSGSPRILSVAALREAVSDSTTPVYWAGAQAGTSLELSRPEPGRAYVRYLTGDAEAGDPSVAFLAVATYARPHPVQELRRQGSKPGGVLGAAPGEAVVYYSRNRPHSVYVAYPGVDVQVEVYDPDVRRALQLVNSGQIVALG